MSDDKPRWTPLADRLDSLPLILAGPMLRRVDPGQKEDTPSVSVWLALKQRREQISLKVRDHSSGKVVLYSDNQSDRTVTIGPHLHITCLTASKKHEDGSKLEPGKLYTYDIDFGAGITLKKALEHPNTSEDTLSYVSYGNIGAPSFVLPPHDRGKLCIAQGS